MQICNNYSFKGKIEIEEGVKGMSHLITDEVLNKVKRAPKGTTLHICKGTWWHEGKIGFSTSKSGDEFISVAFGPKIALNEKNVLEVIEIGIEKMRNGDKIYDNRSLV